MLTNFQQQQAQKILSSYNNTEQIVKSEENDIEKGGEGSRGGKVIGYTKSGKPIYENKKHFYGPFQFSDASSDEKLIEDYHDAVSGYAYHSKGYLYPKSDYKKAYTEAKKILKKRGYSDVEINNRVLKAEDK